MTTYEAVERLTTTHMVEIGPQHNYRTEMLRMDAYRWAKRRGRWVATSTERDPYNPFMSVLRVRLVEGS